MDIMEEKRSLMSKIGKAILRRVDNSKTISAIRRGLVLILPILMVGAFAVIIRDFPINAYNEWLQKAFGGVFYTILTLIHTACYGLFSIFATLSISVCLLRSEHAKSNYVFIGAMTTCVSFIILSGVNIMDDYINTTPLSIKGLFIAVIVSIIVPRLYMIIIRNLKIPFRMYADGLDLEFNDAVLAIIPAATLIIMAAIFNTLISFIPEIDSLYELILLLLAFVFRGKTAGFFNGLFYVVIASLLGFMGVQNKDILAAASENMFWSKPTGYVESQLASGNAGHILTDQFFNSFVMIGGYGAAICLLISVFVFGKRKINRNLAKISVIPTIFNISDVLIYGFPAIYNFYLLAPFIVTPALAYCLSYGAFKFNIVPRIDETIQISETTPVFISGYQLTGSYKGVLLQLMIVVLGAAIYAPFVVMYDKAKRRSEATRMKELTSILQQAEAEKQPIKLLELQGTVGALAKGLAADIKEAIAHKDMEIFYQLQYDNDKICIGAETLLRYKHPVHGYIYPPLVVKLAEETGELTKLEKSVFISAAKDYARLKKETKRSYKISINVTIATLFETNFVTFLKNLKEDYSLVDGEICIEVTEQMAIKSDNKFASILDKIKKLGYKIAIDDFSMGSTSIKYLQSNHFDIVKLDGAIVKDMMVNERSKDIVSSIVFLAESLDFKVLAEFVETQEQMMALQEVGCDYYQGYYFSKAVTKEEFIERIKKEEISRGERPLHEEPEKKLIFGRTK